MENRLMALAYATPPMMRRRGLGNYYPMYGGTGPAMGTRLGQWNWLFGTYHILVALLFLIALILLIILLWKKIQLMDEKISNKDTKKKV